MKLKKICKRVAAFCCVLALLAGTYTDTGYAAPKIGAKTSKKIYIKAKDWPDGPKVESGSAVLMDAETGAVLYAKNPDSLMYPASITKIMTALLTLENCNLKDKMVFAEEAAQSLPYNAVSIDAKAGEKMSIKQCLNATLIYSANDAASGLACEVAGSIKKFSRMMNKRAKELGCKHTHFNNPHGLSDDNHWTTAYDMCLIMKECIKYEDFREIASTRLYTLKKNNKRKHSFTFAAKHKMLFPSSPYYYENIVCGKTGYTQEAVNTLITYAEKDGRGLICCTMKAGYGVAYVDTKALFEYGFKKFRNMDARKKSGPLFLTEDGKLEMLPKTKDDGQSASVQTPENAIPLEMVGDSKVTLPKKVKFSDLTMELEYLDQTAGSTADTAGKNQTAANSADTAGKDQTAAGAVDTAGKAQTSNASADAESKNQAVDPAAQESEAGSCFGKVVYKYQNTVVGSVLLKKPVTEDPEGSVEETEARTGETGGLVKEKNDNNISAQVSRYVEEVMQGQHLQVVIPVAVVLLGLIVYWIVAFVRERNRKLRNKGHSYRL